MEDGQVVKLPNHQNTLKRPLAETSILTPARVLSEARSGAILPLDLLKHPEQKDSPANPV
jgi:hypothetical protein